MVKSLVLGALNVSGFFALVYVAAQRLPTSMASIIMAVVPLAMMLLAWEDSSASARDPGISRGPASASRASA